MAVWQEQPAPAREGLALDGVVAENVATIAAFEGQALGRRSISEQVADRITRRAGSGLFALLHVVWFTGWIAINRGGVPGFPIFDPFPFSLLTLTVSLEAIFLAILLLISQNRASRQTERRAHLDLQINLLAEQESSRTLELLRRIASRLEVDVAVSDRELARETDVGRVATTLDHGLRTE